MRRLGKISILSFIAASLLQSNNTYVQSLPLDNKPLTSSSSIHQKTNEKNQVRNQMIFDKIMRHSKKKA